MNRKFLLALITSCLLFCNRAAAQQPHACAASKINRFSQPVAYKGTIADTAELQYDVKYVKLDIALSNTSAAISGSVVTNAVTTATSGAFVFELGTSLTVDSVLINGAARPVSVSGITVKATYASPIAANTPFKAQIFYHGNGANSSGSGYISNSGISSTFSQPFYSHLWWPCKQALQDKIDSADIWITVDSSLKAGSNGVLKNVTPLGAKKRFEWQSRSPIDYYLVSIAVAKYSDYSYYMHFDNSTDSMPIVNYLLPNTLPSLKPTLDSVGLMINYFSKLFGRYPFWKEKYGHSSVVAAAAMENQTMSTCGSYESYIVVHELAHQWFGDHVTCASWKDTWLNEGFATYMEYLLPEGLYGINYAFSRLAAMHSIAMYSYNNPSNPVLDPTGTVYVDDTTDVERIFSNRLTYNKGGSIVHTLRFEANNDSLFFSAIRTYLQQYGGKTATTEQLKNVVSQVYGRSMDSFFNQWIYKSGWPKFSGIWNQRGDTVYLQLNQTGMGNQAVYSTPLELQLLGQLAGQQADTIIRLYTNAASTMYQFKWAPQISQIKADPRDWLLNESGTFNNDFTLGISPRQATAAHIYPNPVQDKLYIAPNEQGTLKITDITGRELITTPLNNAHQATEYDMSPLANGCYLYHILNTRGEVIQTGKLIKEGY